LEDDHEMLVRFGRRYSWLISKYYPSICLEKLRKPTEHQPGTCLRFIQCTSLIQLLLHQLLGARLCKMTVSG